MKRKRRNIKKKYISSDSGKPSTTNKDLLTQTTTSDIKGSQYKIKDEIYNYILSDIKFQSIPKVRVVDVVANKQYLQNNSDYKITESSGEENNEEIGNIRKKPHISDNACSLHDVPNKDKSNESGIESFVSRLNLGIITLNSIYKEDDKMKKIEIWNRKVEYNLIEIKSDDIIFKEPINGNEFVLASPLVPKSFINSESITEMLHTSESPKIPTTPLKRKPGSPQSTQCDNSNIKKMCDIVFKVPNITTPNNNNRIVTTLKKPAVNIIQSSCVNQHLRSRIEAVRNMKCAANETIRSSVVQKKDDDLLSIFAVSEYNDDIARKPEEIDIHMTETIYKNDQAQNIIEESNIIFKNSPKSASLSSEPPNSLKDSLLNSPSFSPTMFDTKHSIEKQEEIKKSDYESHNEETITNWLTESNKLTAMELIKRFCWYYKKCRRNNCNYFHAIPKDLENALINSSDAELKLALKWILKVKSISLIDDVIPLFIKAYYMQQNDEALIDLVQDVLSIHINKTPHVKSIIKSLSDLEGYDFSKAISEIILTHGRKNSALTDILLNVIVDEENFLINYWNLIINVTKCKHVFIDFGIVDDIIKESLKLNQKDIYIKVCKDFLMKPFVKLDKINEDLLKQLIQYLEQLSLSHYSQVFINIINNSTNKQLNVNDIYDPTIIPIDKINSKLVFNSKFNTKDIIDIVGLENAILNKDVKNFIQIIKLYSHNFLSNSFINHIILVARKLNNVLHLHELLMKSINESSYLMKMIAQFANIWHHIAFNLLPIYDLMHQYNSAAEIITRLPINALLHTQCLYDEEPYRSNLKNIEEKMVFIIKLLTRANYLQDAFKLICMEEFRLNNNSNLALYDYKIKNVLDFLRKSLEGNPEFCSNILHVFIYGRISIPPQLSIWPIYNTFLLNILNLENNSLILHEIPAIQMCHQYIYSPILRGCFVYLYQKTDYLNITTMYNYFCEKSIYVIQNVNSGVITIRSYYSIDEIFIVIRFFLLNMLENNKSPVTIKIALAECNGSIDPNYVPNILNHNLNLESRLLLATSRFTPPLILNKSCTINSNSVKLCLEQLRRNEYNHENIH